MSMIASPTECQDVSSCWFEHQNAWTGVGNVRRKSAVTALPPPVCMGQQSPCAAMLGAAAVALAMSGGLPRAAPMPRRPFWCQDGSGVVMPCSCAPSPPPVHPAFANNCVPALSTIRMARHHADPAPKPTPAIADGMDNDDQLQGIMEAWECMYVCKHADCTVSRCL